MSQSSTRSRRQSAGDRRREREALIIAATRRLFDERGVRDAQIEDVAREVGINRAIIYRHFTGKEELFALVEADYLHDLHGLLLAADDAASSPRDRLRLLTEAFLDFGLAYPAFVDCGVTILRMGPSLLEELSGSALHRIGKGMSDCLARVVEVLETGRDAGDFAVGDVDLLANTLYAMGLGGLQVARLGVVVKERAPGVPAIAGIDPSGVKAHLMRACLSLVEPAR